MEDWRLLYTPEEYYEITLHALRKNFDGIATLIFEDGSKWQVNGKPAISIAIFENAPDDYWLCVSNHTAATMAILMPDDDSEIIPFTSLDECVKAVYDRMGNLPDGWYVGTKMRITESAEAVV